MLLFRRLNQSFPVSKATRRLGTQSLPPASISSPAKDTRPQCCYYTRTAPTSPTQLGEAIGANVHESRQAPTQVGLKGRCRYPRRGSVGRNYRGTRTGTAQRRSPARTKMETQCTDSAYCAGCLSRCATLHALRLPSTTRRHTVPCRYGRALTSSGLRSAAPVAPPARKRVQTAASWYRPHHALTDPFM